MMTFVTVEYKDLPAEKLLTIFTGFRLLSRGGKDSGEFRFF
jgi:hypothetical protein